MVEAERGAKGKGRAAGVVAARDRFYKGDIAKEMVAFLQQHQAPFDLSDFAEYFARVEAPASTTYRGYTVYKHGFSSQGPVLLQTLNILEQFDLAAMKHDSADYVHTVTEAMKLAYADRDTYYADTAFVQVPGEGLLSKAYAKERAALINPRQASKSFIAGNPLTHDPTVKTWPFARYDIADGTAAPSGDGPAADAALARELLSRGLDSAGVSKDTTHMAIIDQAGNVFDATPSGGWVPGAVILGDTGIGMSVRGEQFWLDTTRANQIRPRARPRYTLTPSLVFKEGQPLMALGTPGGDNQDQTILQAFLNIVEFWNDWYPNVHSALPDAPLPRLLLAARGRLQHAQPGSDHSGCGVRRVEGARARREPHPRLRHVGLRHHGDDRPEDQEPPRGRRPATRLLRHRLLGELGLRDR